MIRTIHASRCIAIQTKFIPPTNSRGSRYKAYTESKRSITVGAADNLSAQDNHRAAALALCKKMNWDGDLVEGGTTTGYVYVFLPWDSVITQQKAS